VVGAGETSALRRRAPAPAGAPLVLAYNALSVHPYTWDGGATFALNVLHHLRDALADARIVVFCRREERRIDGSGNVELHPMRISGAPHRIATETLRLPAELRKLGADVFVSPHESIPPRLPCPAVVVAQNLAYHAAGADGFRGERLADRVASRAQRAYYRHRMDGTYPRASRVVAVSHETARLLAERSRLDPARTDVVWEGADSLFLPPPSEGIEREQRILIVSALAPYKNLEQAIGLFAAVQRNRPELKLTIAGPDWRGYRRVVRSTVEDAGLEGAVELAGALHPVGLARLYERSLLLLHLSSCEAFGLPVAEAMRYGLPVVAARRSSLPEVAGDAALYVDPDDPAAAEALERLVASEEERRALAERGRARAAELTWAATAQGVAAAAVEAVLAAGAG
jgi:glycosyltransferase involved in cell wall biosynthesis